jgi:hypothetical protein
MKTLPIKIAFSIIILIIGLALGFKTESVFISVMIITTSISLEKRMTELSKSNPIFEKVSYQITLHQLNFDALKGIPETLVNVKKLDKIVCKTINQGSTELYLIVFNPYLGEPCDCLVFSYKKEQILKFKELNDKLTAK